MLIAELEEAPSASLEEAVLAATFPVRPCCVVTPVWADYGRLFPPPSRKPHSHAMVVDCADLAGTVFVCRVPGSELCLLDHDLIPYVLHVVRKAGNVEGRIQLVLAGCHHASWMEPAHAAGRLSNLSYSLHAAGADSESEPQAACVLVPAARADEVNLEVAVEDWTFALDEAGCHVVEACLLCHHHLAASSHQSALA